jgi:glucose-1-phosphate cytidylyltransferase
MKWYSHHGFTDFVLALGWLGEEIRRYVLEYQSLTSDFTIKLGSPESIEYHNDHPEHNWRVTCKDTGRDTLTGTRLLQAVRGLDVETVMVTYGDGVGDIDITKLLHHHRSHGRMATITAVQPPSRFGELMIDSSGLVREFAEKPQTSSGAINGGFMVFEIEAFKRYFPTDADVMLEREPLTALAEDGQLTAYVHRGFWQPMDTPRERDLLERLWQAGSAPWSPT